MFYEEIRINQEIAYILCQLTILYNSKFIILATSFGTNAVVVTRVLIFLIFPLLYSKITIVYIAASKALFSTEKH